jgi:beta-glucosidase
MKKLKHAGILFICILTVSCSTTKIEDKGIEPFVPPVSYQKAGEKADSLIALMTIDEKLEMIGGYNNFYIKGIKRFNLPDLYMSDATAGVHIRTTKDGNLLGGTIKQSTAFPCPISLAATWDPPVAKEYAKSIGEECRAGGVAVILGPGMNNYRISQCGRNFEYFGEDPYLAARMIENYVVGMENTGTITTLKHFIGNNTEFMRRRSNSIISARELHEINMPAFEAGVNAGAMAVMTSYNLLDGEWCGQSKFVIDTLLRHYLGYKWLVMTDWWSVYNGKKVIKSGQDLEMPYSMALADAKNLLDSGKVSEEDINGMVKKILQTCYAMDIYNRPQSDPKLLATFPEHKKTALNVAREGIVLLKNSNDILPIDTTRDLKILVTGKFVNVLARGGGSARVEGYDSTNMKQALEKQFGSQVKFVPHPDSMIIKDADIVILSTGTEDSEGWDRSFSLPESEESNIMRTVSINPNIIVVVNSGGGIKMTDWSDKVAAIVYAWYPGQNGNIALAEVLSGKTNPSGKLPISIEKKFEDSPGYPYLPKGAKLFTGWPGEKEAKYPLFDVHYNEGVFVGYRWYDSKKIEPLFPFGFGLSYTTFEYNNLKITPGTFNAGDNVLVSFEVKNTGKKAGAEVAEVYVNDEKSSVPRPEKELKGFKKVMLQPGESKKVEIVLNKRAFEFWDTKTNDWLEEPGAFKILVGSSSRDIILSGEVTLN